LQKGVDPRAICFIDFSDDRLVLLRTGSPSIVSDAYYSLYPEMEQEKESEASCIAVGKT